MPFFKRLFFAPPQKFTRHAMIALSGLSSLLYTFSSVICQVSVKIFIFRAETNNAVREIEIYINSCATHAQKICKRLSDHDYVLPSCKSHFSKHKLSPKTKGPRGEFNGILPYVAPTYFSKGGYPITVLKKFFIFFSFFGTHHFSLRREYSTKFICCPLSPGHRLGNIHFH